MSSTNLINSNNSPTQNILNDAIRKASFDVYKRYKLSIGGKNTFKNKLLILLNDSFEIEDEELRTVLIQNTFKTIKKL